MTASQTMDKVQISILQPSSKESSASSSSAKKGDFDAIFDNANKNYTDNKTTSTKADEVSNDAVAHESQVQEKTQKVNKPETDSNQEVQDAKAETSDENIQSLGDENIEPVKDVENISESNNVGMNDKNAVVQSPTVVEKQVSANKVLAESSVKIEDVESIDVSMDSVIRSLEPQVAEAKSDSKQEENSIPAEPIKISDATLDILTKSVLDSFVSVATNSSSAQNATQAVQNAGETASAVQNILGLKTDASKSDSLNVGMQLTDAMGIAKNTAAQPKDVNFLQLNNQSVQEVQSPLVQASESAVVSDVSVSDTPAELPVKNSDAKTSLPQDMLDSMDVKVTAVSNQENASANANSDLNQNANSHHGSHSQSNLNNSSNKILVSQNTQEQAIKLELQSANVDSTVNVNVADNVSIQPNIQANTEFTSAVQKTAQVASSAPREIDQADILSQVNKQIGAKQLQNSEGSKVNIILRPENLGKIELELVSTKEGITARFSADNKQVKELLDKNLDGLKESLGSQGVAVNNVSVKVSESQKQDTLYDFNREMGQQQNQQQNGKNANSNAKFEDNLNGEVDSYSSEVVQDEVVEDNNIISNNVDYKI